MPSGYVHSVKVPRLYKTAARIVQDIREKGGNLKSKIYDHKHPNVSAVYSLCLNTLQKEAQLNYLIIETGILAKESRLDPWLAKILITELLWGKKALNAKCKPVNTILSYEEQLHKALQNCSDVEVLQPTLTTVRKARYVRVNTLLLSLEKAISYFQDEGWTLLPECPDYTAHLEAVTNLSKPKFIQDFHIPELLVFPHDTSFHNHSGYKKGEIILQDKASCLPTQLLNPESGSVVLDMCAAPGMKTTHLAALLENNGKIYAVERNERRYETLCDQVRLTSSSCVETIHRDALTINSDDYPDVEYILVDPSCSGSGMLDRQLMNGDEKVVPHRLKQLQSFQVFLLRHALLNFPNVKRVVYSTCSVNAEENEQVIDEILENVKDAYTLVSIKDMFLKNWKNYSSTEYKCSDKCLYAKSDVDLCNGFFVAVFERNFDVPLPFYAKRKRNEESTNQQLGGNDESNVEEEGALRKRKKRGKRRSTNQIENISTRESVLNASSDSIKIIDEIKKSRSENNDEPPVKNMWKRYIPKNKRQTDDGMRMANRKKGRTQWKKKQ
ncbi:28S rRNA (cytosine-C(5))-methyltransferase [Hylaeus anthracinus]|uniref:28S rRNA (cytosine-C(5))-methyltransferase n=1 Tax=Hylaeus anthracinus TaxID=313031 RepID=UPI0023B958CF|nr:28S rRNA (cytosine-C(5))-methyltransferase [Hylaeus anthracinus]